MKQNVKGTAVVVFSDNLRLTDNPALQAARAYQYLLPVFCFDSESPDKGVDVRGARRWWLHHSLLDLKSSLQTKGSDLYVLDLVKSGDIKKLFSQADVKAVFLNESSHSGFSKLHQKLDKISQISSIILIKTGHNYALDKEGLLKADGTPYQVFTPFWKRFKEQYTPMGYSKTRTLGPLHSGSDQAYLKKLTIGSVGLLSGRSWEEKFHEFWQPGESHALKRFEQFLENPIISYDSQRDFPGVSATSRLSPSLHFGEIHPERMLNRICEVYGPLQELKNPGVETFCKELVWREFARSLYTQYPDFEVHPVREKFRNFPWRQNAVRLKAWQEGRTGYPLVDAGMRELWETGWMHNRIRMVCASFLIKHLNIAWQKGLEWFHETLLDADRPNNAMGWQWVAGCGADAAPFFRIFNPVLQGEKFDPAGNYVRRWCPELQSLPDKWIHKPWKAPKKVLDAAGVVPGQSYPNPIVEHEKSRMQALENYRNL